MDDKPIIDRSGISTDVKLAPTSFSPLLGQDLTNTMTTVNQGIWEDLKDSYIRAGGNETELGIAARINAPEGTTKFNALKSPQLLSTFSDSEILDYMSEFRNIASEEEMSNKIMQIQKEKEFNKDFAERDLWNVPATIGYAGGLLFDTSNVLPASWFKKISKVAHLAVAATSVAGSQAIRDYASKSFITDEQKKFNVAMAGLVGLGFGAGAIGKKWASEESAKVLQKEVVEHELKRQQYVDENLTFVKQREDGSVVVHETFDEWLEGGKKDISITDSPNKWTNAFMRFRMDYVDGKILPKLRLYNSPFGSARWAVDTLVGTTMQTSRRAGTPIEYMIQTTTKVMTRKVEEAAELAYMSFRKDNPSVNISLAKFENDFLAGVEHKSWDPNLAKYYEGNFLSKYNEANSILWERSKSTGIVSKYAVLNPNKNYRPLSYDIDKALSDPIGFKKTLSQGMRLGTLEQADFIATRIKEMSKESDEYAELVKLENKLRSIAESPKKLQKAVDNYYDNNILGIPSSLQVTGKLDSSAKSLEFRDHYINQDLMKEYLDNDFRRSIQKTIRSQTVDHAVTAHYGDSKLQKWKDELIKERDELIAKNPEKSAYYNEQAKEAMEIMAAGINRLKGYSASGALNNSAGHKAVSWLGTLTTIGLMGKSALSNIPETFQVARHWRTLSEDTAKAFIDAYKASGIKMSKIELQRMSYSSTLLQDTRANALQDTSTALSKADELPSKISSAAYYAYGQTFVTNLMEAKAAGNLTDFIVKVANVGKKASKQELKEFKELGFTVSDTKKIVEQFNKYSVKTEDGVLTSGLTDWEGSIGIKARAIVHREVRKIVIAPDSITKSLWFDTAAGRMFGQFKGFMLTALERYALTDLQKGPKEFGAMLAVRTVGGTLAYITREMAVKDIEDIDLDGKTLLHEGLMRGGGIAGIDFTSDTLDMVGLGLGRLLGTNRAMKRKSAYGNDPILKTVAGAPAAVIGDITKTISNISQGNFEPEAYKHLLKYPAGHVLIQAVLNRVLD